jgi:outer membrane protein assembly factor BamA
LFPIEDGDIFSRQKIADGLDNLRKAYGQLGYVDFVAVPDAKTNDVTRLIYLRIDLDEGKQFYVSSVNIVGVDESARQALLKDFLLKSGNVFNSRFMDLFWKSHPSLLPDQTSPSSETNLRLDERMATVAIALNLRGCPVD